MANNKKQWKEILEDFPELQLREFLELLPFYDEEGKPFKCCLPVVVFNRNDREMLEERLAKRGYKFVSSMTNYIEGYHHPFDTSIRAIGYIVE